MEKDKIKQSIWLGGLSDEEKYYYKELDKVDEFGRVV
tara:strand:- start:46 stop:156 length:111 start_codon:yes stop_codon:yes gene_type:complete